MLRLITSLVTSTTSQDIIPLENTIGSCLEDSQRPSGKRYIPSLSVSKEALLAKKFRESFPKPTDKESKVTYQLTIH